MINLKVIFAGPVGAGKTTAISSISDETNIVTDDKPKEDTKDQSQLKKEVLDYGAVHLEGGECIHLYGTPAQEKYNFMWEILTKGGIGLVLLLDNTRKNPFQDLKFYLDQFQDFIERTQIIIGITQMDKKSEPYIEQYHDYLNQSGLSVPIFEVDARNKHDVSMLLKGLLYSLDPCIDE